MAILASALVNTIKLYETDILYHFQAREEALPQPPGRVNIFDGITDFKIGGGDMPLNLFSRLKYCLDDSRLSSYIARELISRCMSENTVFRRMRSKQRARIWPASLDASPPNLDKTVTDTAAFRKQDNNDTGPSFLLLNDTSRLSQGFHIGTLYACESIRYGMNKRGWKEIGWANTREHFDRIMQHGSPDLVVLNGEGTLHNNAPRAELLIDLALEAKRRGAPVALINSVWQGNSDLLKRKASQLDLIHVREGNSKADFGSPKVCLTPDISIPIFRKMYRETSHSSKSKKISVIDCVVHKTSDQLFDFASYIDGEFYCMPMPSLKRHRNAEHSAGSAIRPRLLKAADLLTCGEWVSGRYHGLIAALCADRRVCALPSNTFKIEGMLRDAGIFEEVMLPANWAAEPNARRLDMVRRLHDHQSANRVEAAKRAYLVEAEERIENLFDRLSAFY